MQYPFIIKFSQTQNLSDARYASGMWADMIGFCFDPNSPAFIEPSKFKEMKSWLSGPKIVGEFGHQGPEWVNDFIREFSLDAVQLPANYKDLDKISKDCSLILAFENEVTTVLEAADMYYTYSLEAYQKLKAQTEVPLLLELKKPYQLNLEVDGIAFACEQESKIGMSDQTAITEFLESQEMD